jgi:hypothetical protein
MSDADRHRITAILAFSHGIGAATGCCERAGSVSAPQEQAADIGIGEQCRGFTRHGQLARG